jgi:EAL domain-containing protein (putative c-di-GMP-specific phosphodiesterase class I)/sensor domain CHASE-containing protein
MCAAARRGAPLRSIETQRREGRVPLPTPPQIRRALRAPWDPATIVAVALLALVVAMWLGRVVVPTSARADDERVDTRAVDAPLARVRGAWAAEFEALREPVRRLALDDATYEFVRRPNFPYVDDHYSPARLQALAVDTVLILDRDAKPVFWRRPNDPDNRGFDDAREFVARLPALPPPTERRGAGKPVMEGVVTFRGVPALVTAIAIEPGSGRGEPRGYVLHARPIDGAVSRRIGSAAPPGVDVMPGTDPMLPPPLRQRLNRSLVPLVVADEHRLHGYLPIVDLEGRLLRVYAVQADRPVRVVAATPAARPARSWPLVIGASLLLLLVGAAGYWVAFAPSRRTRLESREQIERLARALAEEARSGPVPAHVSAAPELPQVAIAEALARIGALPDETHEPEWMRRMPAALTPYDVPRDAGAAPHAADADVRTSADEAALVAAHDAANDEHDWLIGTPDVLLDGQGPTPFARSLEAAEAAESGESAESAEVATPAEPTELAKLTDPAEFSAPADAAESAQPTEPPEREQPAESSATIVVGGAVRQGDAAARAEAREGSEAERHAPSDRDLVHRMLQAGRLCVYYQPQIDVARGEIVAVEALVHWLDDSGTPHGAGEFFGGLATPDALASATEFVVRRAAEDRREWSRQIGRHVAIGVSVGLAELREPDFVDRVLRAVQEGALPVGALELEVPEGALARREGVEAATLEQAYRRGLALAIGGFFASDAPLGALMHMPFGKLKIHRSLIADLPDDAHARSVVDAALAIGRTLGVAVCADGVEAAAQAEYLEEQGCPLVQGGFYSPPLDAGQIAALLRRSGTDTVRLPLMSVEQLETHARTAGIA